MVRVLKGHGWVIRVEPVRNGPVIRNAFMRGSGNEHVDGGDALTSFVDRLNYYRSTADRGDEATAADGGNGRIAHRVLRAGCGGGDIVYRCIGVGCSRDELLRRASLAQRVNGNL